MPDLAHIHQIFPKNAKTGGNIPAEWTRALIFSCYSCNHANVINKLNSSSIRGYAVFLEKRKFIGL